MTTYNLARHADDPNTPFWEMLKSGDDAFFATGQPPSVAVCDQRYVFNPMVTNSDLDPSTPCPPSINSTPVAEALRPARSSGPVSAYPLRAFGGLDRVIN
jgi:murein L,D-transpeptidase YafK